MSTNSSTHQRLYRTNDLWANRNPNAVRKEEGESLTKTLLRRIVSWADRAKSSKTGQDFVHSAEFRDDLHTAVILSNYQHSKTGLSKNEKIEANQLWEKYSIYGRLVVKGEHLRPK